MMKTHTRKRLTDKPTIGWREWAAFPNFGISRIKAKIDTGARTSALHAWKIRPFEQDGRDWVEFDVHPAQRNNQLYVSCVAPVVDRREVRSSSGHAETRYVIATALEIGGHQHEIELTLTNRDEMGFRLLIGRSALRGYFLIDPERSFLVGK